MFVTTIVSKWGVVSGNRIYDIIGPRFLYAAEMAIAGHRRAGAPA